MGVDGNRPVLESSGYALEGSILELASSPAPADGRAPRVSVVAWRIRRGHINGVNVVGEVVLVISDSLAVGPSARAVLLDEQASPEQVLALFDAFQGRLGGPLAHLVPSNGEAWGLSQVPIEYRLGPGRVDISVPDRLRLVVRDRAANVSLDVREHGLSWHDHEASATYRRFHVQSARSEGGTCLR